MKYNNWFTLTALFQNPNLEKVLPQLDSNGGGRNSDADIERRIFDYLKNVLGGEITAKKEITAKGQGATVYKRVCQMQPYLETMFNAGNEMNSSLRFSVKRMYLPYVSLAQIESIKTLPKKIALLNDIVDNFKYNPNFINKNQRQTAAFLREQQAWKDKVGYKERRFNDE